MNTHFPKKYCLYFDIVACLKNENIQTFIFNQEFCSSMNHKIIAKKSLFSFEQDWTEKNMK